MMTLQYIDTTKAQNDENDDSKLYCYQRFR